MPIVSDPNEGRFSEMLALLRHSAGFLKWVIEILASMSIQDRQLAHALDAIPAVVDSRSRALIDAILSHDFDESLAQHGLDNESLDWQFKFAGYKAALETTEELDVSPDSSHRKRRKGLKKAQIVLKWLNVPLRSIAAAIPGVGGAYNEIKDGVEAAVETAVDQPGAATRVAATAARAASRVGRLVTPPWQRGTDLSRGRDR